MLLQRSCTEAGHGLAIGLQDIIKKVLMDLENRPKSGRPSKAYLEKLLVKVRQKLKEGKQGWTTQQVNEMIVKEGNVHYHQIYIYTLLHKWGFKQNVPRKVHVNTASYEEKKQFKKSTENTRLST